MLKLCYPAECTKEKHYFRIISINSTQEILFLSAEINSLLNVRVRVKVLQRSLYVTLMYLLVVTRPLCKRQKRKLGRKSVKGISLETPGNERRIKTQL